MRKEDSELKHTWGENTQTAAAPELKKETGGSSAADTQLFSVPKA